MMEKPYSSYRYGDYAADYDNWAIECSKTKKPLLRTNDAVRLENLYADEVCFTLSQHEENIKYLEGLQWEIDIVWTASQQEESNMGNLVDDYKKYYGLDGEDRK